MTNGRFPPAKAHPPLVKKGEVPKFEIGYWQHVAYGGQGYMTEAVEAIAKLALDQLGAQRLQLECYPHSARSIALARRCGFRQEARLAAYRRHHQTGELHDWLIFARFPPRNL